MILSASLSRPIVKEGRAFGGYFTTPWKWLNERHAKRSVKLIPVHYSNLMVKKMTPSESVEDYVSRVD